ncbi:MAG TPA: 4-hydroxythreonine-4-phosphate dehydrogenase PdxA [Burkholderiaceae bacterium]|nr:4-hydroxythreonine-4-phosphate dehydrogenase PdxA [Burkholderiaceae bacterium]
MPCIAITTGEPAGIGPEVALRAAVDASVPCDLLGDAQLLQATARSLGLPWPLPERVQVVHEGLAAPAQPGELDVRNARYVLRLLDRALEGWRRGRYAALCTAPVHKAVINDAGISFSGHTEYLAVATGTKHVVMLLVGGGLRVALVTTHLPLSAVPRAITRERLDACLDVMQQDLVRRFAIPVPRIAVIGLNPHAGEGGHLGREEIDVIAPAIIAARQRGIEASGPWPADTIFVARNAMRADAILAMYHDQGLATLKYASFGRGVNVTLGLPVVRTSADHGTALDLAGRAQADAGSMKEALALAAELAQRAGPDEGLQGKPDGGS